MSNEHQWQNVAHTIYPQLTTDLPYSEFYRLPTVVKAQILSLWDNYQHAHAQWQILLQDPDYAEGGVYAEYAEFARIPCDRILAQLNELCQ